MAKPKAVHSEAYLCGDVEIINDLRRTTITDMLIDCVVQRKIPLRFLKAFPCTVHVPPIIAEQVTFASHRRYIPSWFIALIITLPA